MKEIRDIAKNYKQYELDKYRGIIGEMYAPIVNFFFFLVGRDLR